MVTNGKLRHTGVTLLVEPNIRRSVRRGLCSGVWGGERDPVLPHKFDKLLLKLAGEWDDRIKVIGPDDHHTFITLRDSENELRCAKRRESYDECTTLFLIRAGQHTHGINNLDLRVLIYDDRLRIFRAGLGEISAKLSGEFVVGTHA